MEEINQALFFSVAKQDFDQIDKLLKAEANPNALYEIEKGKFISALNLFITKCALISVKVGQNNALYKSYMLRIKQMIKRGNLECKCLNEHKCPLYIVLEIFKVTQDEEIIQGKCEIIRFLIINGATLKYQPKQNKKAQKSIGKWKLRWLDLEGIKAYLVTKHFNYVQTKI